MALDANTAARLPCHLSRGVDIARCRPTLADKRRWDSAPDGEAGAGGEGLRIAIRDLSPVDAVKYFEAF